MPPTEKSSPVVRRPILLWPELLEHARCWRSESRKFAHNPISDVEFVFDQDDQPKIFALGAFDQGSVQQTILSTTLSDTMAHIEVKRDFAPISSDASEDDENEEECEEMPPLPDYSIIPENSPQTMLEPIFQPLTTLRNPADVPKEIAMMCERMRTNVMNGVTDFSYSANGKCILYDSSLNLNLLKLTENETQPIGKWCDGVPLNAQLSPVDPSLTAFVANSELHVDRNGRKYHSTVAPSHTVINGASSFIAQEELDRFEGFWWSPTKPELIYESVDEGKVSELTFECPGKPLTGLMRYPLAGTRNAISRLRLLNCADETPVDSPLAFELTDIYPGYEYLARVGWIPSGSGIYAQLMNRLQTQSVLVFFPRTVFTKPSSISNVEEIKKEVHILYSESCPNDAWINVNNLLSPLPQVYGGETTKRFIYGSEKTGNNHLYFHIYSKDSAGCPVADIYPITHGEWNVVRDSPVSIDHNRQLVYFLANLHDPTTTNLCVASYAKNASEEPRSLTPRHLTYRNDRSKSKLCLHMDYGFVCWLSSISQPPECYVYRFKYFECGDKTPVAVLHSRLVLPKPSNILNAYSDFRLTMDTSVFDSIPEHSKPLIHSYVSKNSGIHHYGIIMRPFNYQEGQRYPTIHHVYGGPGVQLVKNCWTSWIQFLKYTSLGFCVIVIDGRGSANRGINFEKPIKNAMGTVEVADQVEGLLEMSRKFQCIAMNHVGVTGWSYGGYMCLMLLANHPSLYRCCVAGGAVIDWRLYDTCYTERYMGIPDDLETDIYGNSSVLSQVSRLPDESDRILICHGFMDENVHFHHTEKIVEALTKAGKHYQLLVFPSEHHGIRQPTAGEYLDANVLLFFQKALQN